MGQRTRRRQNAADKTPIGVTTVTSQRATTKRTMSSKFGSNVGFGFHCKHTTMFCLTEMEITPWPCSCAEPVNAPMCFRPQSTTFDRGLWAFKWAVTWAAKANRRSRTRIPCTFCFGQIKRPAHMRHSEQRNTRPSSATNDALRVQFELFKKQTVVEL